MRWKIGDVTVTKVVELEQELPLKGLLPAATEEALARHLSWLMPHFIDDEGNTDLSIHAFVVESDGLRIIVDTCVGDRDMAGLPGFTGDPAFLKRLAAAGFPVESIDIVCCTHLHFDHVGWNTRLEGGKWVPTFPNARYLFCRAEYDAWMAEPGGYAWNLPDTVAPVVEAGLVDTDSTRRLPGADLMFAGRTSKTMVGERQLEATDVADAVLFLSSPLSDLVQGQTLVVDGGAAIHV